MISWIVNSLFNNQINISLWNNFVAFIGSQSTEYNCHGNFHGHNDCWGRNLCTLIGGLKSKMAVTGGPGQISLQWCHNECHNISHYQHLNCLLSHLFKCTSKKSSKLFVTGLCEENPPLTRPVTQKIFQFDKAIMSCYKFGVLNSSDGVIWIFQKNEVNTFVVDALAPFARLLATQGPVSI